MEQATPTSPWHPNSAPEMEAFSLNRLPTAAATRYSSRDLAYAKSA